MPLPRRACPLWPGAPVGAPACGLRPSGRLAPVWPLWPLWPRAPVGAPACGLRPSGRLAPVAPGPCGCPCMPRPAPPGPACPRGPGRGSLFASARPSSRTARSSHAHGPAAVHPVAAIAVTARACPGARAAGCVQQPHAAVRPDAPLCKPGRPPALGRELQGCVATATCSSGARCPAF